MRIFNMLVSMFDIERGGPADLISNSCTMEAGKDEGSHGFFLKLKRAQKVLQFHEYIHQWHVCIDIYNRITIKNANYHPPESPYLLWKFL